MSELVVATKSQAAALAVPLNATETITRVRPRCRPATYVRLSAAFGVSNVAFRM
jgi:hypothetical protein